MWFTENAANQVASITAAGEGHGLRPTERGVGARQYRLRA